MGEQQKWGAKRMPLDSYNMRYRILPGKEPIVAARPWPFCAQVGRRGKQANAKAAATASLRRILFIVFLLVLLFT
jgi:hypothetical protein